eukprot:sb/3474161/
MSTFKEFQINTNLPSATVNILEAGVKLYSFISGLEELITVKLFLILVIIGLKQVTSKSVTTTRNRYRTRYRNNSHQEQGQSEQVAQNPAGRSSCNHENQKRRLEHQPKAHHLWWKKFQLSILVCITFGPRFSDPRFSDTPI